MPSCSLIDDAVFVAAAAARAGGGVLAGTDHTTSADRASQAAVVADLRATFPDHVVVGEGGTEPGSDTTHVWHVDGLAGTSNVANGIAWYCVSVALRCHEHGADEVVAGAVFDPVHDELYCAGRGRGATANGMPMRVADVGSLDRAVVVSQTQFADPAREFTTVFETLLTTAGGVTVPGAPALIMSHIAAGHFTAYVERDMAAWDISAGQLILEEAGGTVTDLTGARVTSAAATDVVASNSLIHTELLAALR